MIHFFDYRSVKQMTEERMNRSLREFGRRQLPAEPKISSVEIPLEAEVIELTFSAHCESDQIGA